MQDLTEGHYIFGVYLVLTGLYLLNLVVYQLQALLSVFFLAENVLQ